MARAAPPALPRRQRRVLSRIWLISRQSLCNETELELSIICNKESICKYAAIYGVGWDTGRAVYCLSPISSADDILVMSSVDCLGHKTTPCLEPG